MQNTFQIGCHFSFHFSRTNKKRCQTYTMLTFYFFNSVANYQLQNDSLDLTDLSGRHVRHQVCRISWDMGRLFSNDRLLFAALFLSHLKGFVSFVWFISISDNRLIRSLSNNDSDEN